MGKHKNAMHVSVVIPVYNEENNIPLLYKEIKSAFTNLPGTYELIFVNDGSVDSSQRAICSVKDNDSAVRVILFDKHYGKTAALDAGFKSSRGDIILTIDCDLQYDPKDLLRVVDRMQDGAVDAVFGRRVRRTTGIIKQSTRPHWVSRHDNNL